MGAFQRQRDPLAAANARAMSARLIAARVCWLCQLLGFYFARRNKDLKDRKLYTAAQSAISMAEAVASIVDHLMGQVRCRSIQNFARGCFSLQRLPDPPVSRESGEIPNYEFLGFFRIERMKRAWGPTKTNSGYTSMIVGQAKWPKNQAFQRLRHATSREEGLLVRRRFLESLPEVRASAGARLWFTSIVASLANKFLASC